ncbi:MAG: putative FmdB family regulatory protein [Lentisphaeria bacterium]|jgi:putative FmdB family regulatory protein
MPIYEYKCEACGHGLEALQKIGDASLTECPSCGQSSLKKKVSAAAFRLKGGGWYETDFKSGTKKNLASGDKSTSADESSGGKSSAPNVSASAPAAASSTKSE